MAERIIRVLLQAGVILVVIAAFPYKIFELDRYFIAKELVLNVIALLVAVLLMAKRRSLSFDLADALLAFFLLWSAASALFATNYWLAQRSLGVTASGAVIFWGARFAAERGAYRPILVAVAIAAVCAAGLALSQAYGLETEYFSANRAPGGTFGNRNFVAHIAVIGLPALVWSTVTARRPLGALLGSLGGALVAGALVLSRSRAAWLAVAASLVILLVPMIASRKYWRGGQVGGRFARFTLAAAIGGMAAVALPNTLSWKSDTPYLDSAREVVDYKKGSGRGRVSQYRNSMSMAVANPLFGVGPGNWPVEYVLFAPPRDRSIAEDGMTANPWPSSDWVAFVSERGLIPTLALLGVFAVLFFGALRRWSELKNPDAVLAQCVLAGTIVATMVVSAFDVVLILAAPSFLVWSVLGATSGIPATSGARRGREVRISSKALSLAAAGIIVVVLASAVRSTTQTIAMASVGQGGHTAGWLTGAMWDPGSYRINLRVADLYSRRGHCSVARGYARQAAGLFPNAPAARRIVNACG
ncbi:MAG TPA: O-antigen ligase family protein [Gemmatimonadaceae bacterium]|nr:O-antigen ligase family protein [Gemmatimonadaceae bacterium]